MALPILDGNQTAATLSTIITGGAHIPAHTVVSLGSQAISDISNAVSSVQVSGTVTANVPLSPDAWAGDDGIKVVGNGSDGALRIGGYDPSTGAQLNLEEGGGIPIFVCGSGGGTQSLPISGTVTANNPSGALTTRFGSVATANLAIITSAVTNTSRKYLLAQNISAGTVTIGIGFSPTTTQGIQLTAGGGLTFDAFCPTGAVYWLGAVTGANYCLIEG